MNNIFLGDIHGEFEVVTRFLKKYDITDTNIIQVGDFGVGFKSFVKEKRQLSIINETLKRRNVYLYAIRGNHDLPEYFKNDPFGFSNIKLLPDYTVLTLGSKRMLFIGGAVSVDRGYRYTEDQKKGIYDLKGYESWWHDEVFVLDEEKLNGLTGIDIVVTHTTTSYSNPPIGLGVGGFVNSMIEKFNDITLEQELIDERKMLDRVFEILKSNGNNITNHLYGHFHDGSYIVNDGIKHQLLNINEFYEIY